MTPIVVLKPMKIRPNGESNVRQDSAIPMGLFWKKAKTEPTVEAEGIRATYDLANECWQFSYKGADFVTYGPVLVLPPPEQLSSMLADIAKLRPEMTRRLAEGWKDAKDVKTNDGETFLVNITDYQAQGSYEVSWSGGESWGDMGIDFTIKNHEITEESWGD